MFKKLLTVGALACTMFIGSTAFAQNEEQKQAEYIQTGLWSNWSVGGSLMYSYGNGVGNVGSRVESFAIGHNGNIGIDLLAEKELSPIWSYRFVISVPGLLKHNPDHCTNTVSFDRYVGILPMGFKMNLNNWINGYDPERCWNFYLYAGGGAAFSHYGVGGFVGLLAQGGAGVQMKLGESWNTPKHNGSIVFAELAMDDYCDVPNILKLNFHNLTAMVKVGYMYNIGITAADQEMIAQKSRLNEDYVKGLENQISALEQDLANSKQAEQRLQNRVNQLENENANLRNQLAEAIANQNKTIVAKTMETINEKQESGQYGMPFSIQFATNQYRVSAAERGKLKAVADIMKANPSQKYTVAGFCDITGSEEYNQTLSEKRAESVKKELVNKYGEKEEQLITRGYGKSKPFGDAKYGINRRVSFHANIN